MSSCDGQMATHHNGCDCHEANWQKRLDEAVARAEAAEDVLRGLAAYVGCGGYNAEIVNPTIFDEKIRVGIELTTKPLLERARDAERERDALRARVEKLEEALEGLLRAYSVRTLKPKIVGIMQEEKAGNAVALAQSVLEETTP